KLTVALGRKTLGAARKEQPPAEVIDHPHDLVALAFAARFDQWLLTTQRPSVAQRPPVGETGFVSKQQQSTALASRALTSRPLHFAPVLASHLVEVIRDKARLLVRQAQIAQQFAQILHIVGARELALYQILDQSAIPTATCIAGSFGASHHQCLQ